MKQTQILVFCWDLMPRGWAKEENRRSWMPNAHLNSSVSMTKYLHVRPSLFEPRSHKPEPSLLETNFRCIQMPENLGGNHLVIPRATPFCMAWHFITQVSLSPDSGLLLSCLPYLKIYKKPCFCHQNPARSLNSVFCGTKFPKLITGCLYGRFPYWL